MSDVICKHYRMSRSCLHCAADDAPLPRYPQQAEQNAEGREANVSGQLSGKGDGTPSGLNKETTMNVSDPAPSAPAAADRDALLARACGLAGLDYDTFLRIKAYLPVAAPAADGVVVPRELLEKILYEHECAAAVLPDAHGDRHRLIVDKLQALLTAASAKGPK